MGQLALWVRLYIYNFWWYWYNVRMVEQGEHLNQELYRFDSSFIIARVSKKNSETIQQHSLGRHLYEMQEIELKKRFCESPYLKPNEASSLAKKLNMKRNTVYKWFYTQRLKSENKAFGVNRGEQTV